jgi:hypothetical protein
LPCHGFNLSIHPGSGRIGLLPAKSRAKGSSSPA